MSLGTRSPVFDCVHINPETGKPWFHPPRPYQYAAVIVALPTLAERRATLALLEDDWELLGQVEFWVRYFWERQRLQRRSRGL